MTVNRYGVINAIQLTVTANDQTFVYGETIPECDAEDGQKEVSLVFGDGVPAYGDTRAAFQLDRTQVFVGKIGDVAVEIAYALPQYRREGGAFEVVVRGAVIANIVQMPILSAAKSKK